MASPKYVHVLIPRTCDYISLPDKRDFIDVIKSRVLDGELILYYPDGSNGITIFIRGR